MKVFLMHRDRDFDLNQELPANAQTLAQDLELATVWNAMAAGDELLLEVARRALLSSLHEPDEILYRQQVLTDCLQNASVARELYALAGEALKAEKSVWGGLYRDAPSTLLSTSVRKMEVLVEFLKRIRALIDEHGSRLRSEGFKRFCAMVAEELDEQYFELLDTELKELNFHGGTSLSAQLAAGNRGTGYMLRRVPERSWLGRVFDRSGYSFTIPDRDDNGFRALGELQDKGVNLVANALAQSVEHVRSFFTLLRIEIGFYVTCVNLHQRIGNAGEPTCLPDPLSRDQLALSTRAIYDPSLALTLEQHVVGNDVDAHGKSLVMITGANQGGKSTLLRALGLAQLMMQCGMFVAAGSFRASVCDGLFSHYKREEDLAMESGKLDEELRRMSEIADRITPGSILLCNESFASTNEREGSEIARQVVRALLEQGVKVYFVTHMFDLADGFYRHASDGGLFLRAERGADGARPFKLTPGRPLPTSYGEDSYKKVFGKSPEVEAGSLLDSTRP